MSRRSSTPSFRLVAMFAVAAGAGVSIASVLHSTSPLKINSESSASAAAINGPTDCPAAGDVCSDGSVYVAVSPDARSYVFTTLDDAPYALDWIGAVAYAEGLDAAFHHDWRLSTADELHVIYKNRDKGALKGTFDESGSRPFGWYWSATHHPGGQDGAWVERFSDGYRVWFWKGNDASVRPVRTEPRP